MKTKTIQTKLFIAIISISLLAGIFSFRSNIVKYFQANLYFALTIGVETPTNFLLDNSYYEENKTFKFTWDYNSDSAEAIDGFRIKVKNKTLGKELAEFIISNASKRSHIINNLNISNEYDYVFRLHPYYVRQGSKIFNKDELDSQNVYNFYQNEHNVPPNNSEYISISDSFMLVDINEQNHMSQVNLDVLLENNETRDYAYIPKNSQIIYKDVNILAIHPIELIVPQIIPNSNFQNVINPPNVNLKRVYFAGNAEHTIIFSQPIKISFSLSKDENRNNLEIRHYNPSNNSFNKVENLLPNINQTENTISIWTDHMSVWGLFEVSTQDNLPNISLPVTVNNTISDVRGSSGDEVYGGFGATKKTEKEIIKNLSEINNDDLDSLVKNTDTLIDSEEVRKLIDDKHLDYQTDKKKEENVTRYNEDLILIESDIDKEMDNYKYKNKYNITKYGESNKDNSAYIIKEKEDNKFVFQDLNTNEEKEKEVFHNVSEYYRINSLLLLPELEISEKLDNEMINYLSTSLYPRPIPGINEEQIYENLINADYNGIFYHLYSVLLQIMNLLIYLFL